MGDLAKMAPPTKKEQGVKLADTCSQVSEEEIPSMIVFCCFQSRRGWCRYGDGCRYWHGGPASLPPNAAAAVQAGTSQMACERIVSWGECKHQRRGRHP